jgi:hypothetical protein
VDRNGAKIESSKKVFLSLSWLVALIDFWTKYRFTVSPKEEEEEDDGGAISWRPEDCGWVFALRVQIVTEAPKKHRRPGASWPTLELLRVQHCRTRRNFPLPRSKWPYFYIHLTVAIAFSMLSASVPIITRVQKEKERVRERERESIFGLKHFRHFDILGNLFGLMSIGLVTKYGRFVCFVIMRGASVCASWSSQILQLKLRDELIDK